MKANSGEFGWGEVLWGELGVAYYGDTVRVSGYYVYLEVHGRYGGCSWRTWDSLWCNLRA